MAPSGRPAAERTITVLLVDDHAIVREGYRRLIERTEDLQVVAEAGTGEDAYRLCGEVRPDVVIMDLSLPGIGGLEAVRRITARDPRARVLVFSMHDDASFSSRALKAGARGYVTKASAPDALVEAIRTVAGGRLYLSHDIARELAVLNLPGRRNPVETLSAREFEVFRMLVEGRSVADIARVMSLSRKTIANYQSALRTKLDVANTTQAVRLAMAHGLFHGAADPGDLPDG
ncbi:MAG: response regulator transcription factor [Betaproteobacteria bacterium]|jgi:DNA-binding NarL/FixJ family response regulator